MENWNQLKHLRLQINHRVFRAFAEEKDTENAAIDYLAWLEKVGRGKFRPALNAGKMSSVWMTAPYVLLRT